MYYIAPENRGKGLKELNQNEGVTYKQQVWQIGIAMLRMLRIEMPMEPEQYADAGSISTP